MLPGETARTLDSWSACVSTDTLHFGVLRLCAVSLTCQAAARFGRGLQVGVHSCSQVSFASRLTEAVGPRHSLEVSQSMGAQLRVHSEVSTITRRFISSLSSTERSYCKMGCCNDKLETGSTEVRMSTPRHQPESAGSFCDVSLESSPCVTDTAQFTETWRVSEYLHTLPAQGSQDLSWLFDRSWLSGCREDSFNSTLRHAFIRTRDLRRSTDDTLKSPLKHTHKTSLENLPHVGDQTVNSPCGSRPRSISSISQIEWENSSQLNCTFGEELPE